MHTTAALDIPCCSLTQGQVSTEKEVSMRTQKHTHTCKHMQTLAYSTCSNSPSHSSSSTPSPTSSTSPAHPHLQHEPVHHVQHNLLPLSILSLMRVCTVCPSGAPTQSSDGITEYRRILQGRNTLHNTTPSLYNTTPALHKITHSLHNTTNDAQPHFILGTGKR